MRHFNYFQNGGPAPSQCIACGAVKELFEVGQLLTGGMAQICLRCSQELASFIGYVEAAPIQATIEAAKADIAKLEQDLAKVPSLVDGLINGIRSSVTDFVFAVSYSDDADKPVPVQADAKPDSGANEGSETASRQRKAPVKSSSK
jgi:hypothetical protein